MVLENKSYVPTLAVRASEMNGLEYLPNATKDKMTPCFLLAPWANSNSLGRTIERIERAFPKRPYFLDIEKDYELTNGDSEPQRELARLRDPTNSFANWADFISKHDQIWPCVQTWGQSESEIRTQIGSFQSLGRPFAMRIERNRFPENMDDIVGGFASGGTADFAVILEGGWTRDPLSLAAWFDGVIAGNLNPIDAAVPVVVSCTSIPKMFTFFNGNEPVTVPFNNRKLMAQVARARNRTNVIYGDWGSTRPREPVDFANRPIDRVDYPVIGGWYIARNKEKEWNYRDAARAIVKSPHWNGNLGIWGEEMILDTTINEELGINTPQKNVAARVNIHLHLQAFEGQLPESPTAFDEDWQDV